MEPISRVDWMEHKSWIIALCVRYRVPYQDREDLIQDVLLTLYRRNSEYNSKKGALTTWVEWIFRGQLFRMRYQNKRRIFEYDSRKHDPQIKGETFLPEWPDCPRNRNIIELHFQGYNFAEIGVMYDLSRERIRQIWMMFVEENK